MSAQQQQPKELNIGDAVTYQTLDEEYYYRGYGVLMEAKKAKIVRIKYVMDNGDEIAADSPTLKKVEVAPPTTSSQADPK